MFAMPLGMSRDEIVLVSTLVMLGADVLSLISCVWLLCKIWRLPAAQGQRLLPRQVVVLAASDVCLALAGWVVGLAQAPVLAWKVAVSWTYHATLLAELHIVLGFGAQMVGLPAAGRCLSSCVWSPWLLAAVLTGSEMQLSSANDLQWSRATAFVVCICFLGSLLTFAFVLCRARTSNTAMARRSWRRASSYVANFLITFAPLVYAIFAEGPGMNQNEWSWLWFVGYLGLHLNGILNALTYFAQSRYSRSALQTPKALPAQSLVVRFAGDTEECSGDASTAGSTAELTANAQEDKV